VPAVLRDDVLEFGEPGIADRPIGSDWKAWRSRVSLRLICYSR
jgi:hypothetical protein